MISRMVLERNFSAIRERIARAAARSGRSVEAVRMVAVTKTVGAEEARILWELGARDFGENRVQELQRKREALTGLDLRWHMIGHLQTNKVNKIVGEVEMIHSLDSARLASAIDSVAVRKGCVCKCLIEVNVSGEESKEGVSPDALMPLLDAIGPLAGVRVCGLMTMAPFSDDAERSRPVFAALRALRDRAARNAPPNAELKHLSMGMTRDFEVAIEEGADIVRIGTALFEETLHAL